MALDKIKNILEAVLVTADRPMKVPQLEALFEEDEDKIKYVRQERSYPFTNELIVSF